MDESESAESRCTRKKRKLKIALCAYGVRVDQPEGRKPEASLHFLRFDLRSASFLCSGYATRGLWHLPEVGGAISRKVLGGCLNYSGDAALPKAIRKMFFLHACFA